MQFLGSMLHSNQHKIIVVETNQARRDYLRSIISGWGYIPFSFEKETVCLDNLQPLNPNLVISGSLSLERTLRLVIAVKMINRSLPVVIISDDRALQDFINNNGFADVTTISATSEPFEIKEAITRIQTNKLKSKTFLDPPLLIGQHPEVLKIKKMTPKISRSEETVHIHGETGTGKELVAKAIHNNSARKNNPFIKINMAEFQRELFDVNLLGYGTKILPDLHANKKGKFEYANTGTLYLDAIEKIPPALQAHVLYVLEKGGMKTFGANKDEKIDVRIISSANTDLNLLVEKGKFRKDLYYRLNIFLIKIPPLSDRTDDISLLADYFADKFCMESGKSYFEFSKKTKGILSRYSWPGNVQELKNVVRNYVLLDNKDRLVDNLFACNQTDTTGGCSEIGEHINMLPELSDVNGSLMDSSKLSLKDICRRFATRTEKKFMRKALEITNWNRKKAAAMLNISYKSMLNKIKAYNLDIS